MPPAPGFGYRSARALARLLVGLFYREVEIVGAEHIPAQGPLIVAANHQNALVDPALLFAAMPRPLVPLAKAPLFHHPLVLPLLAALGAVPVHRARESGADPARNEAMFRATGEALGRGRAILIFPEGISHEHTRLQPLRTGAARILLEAEASGAPAVTLLPVGLVFREPGTFRAGWAAILVGEPVTSGDCVQRHKSDPPAAARELTMRLAAALERQMVETEDYRTLCALRLAEGILRSEDAAPPGPAEKIERLRRAARAHRYLLRVAPAELEALRSQVEAWAEHVEEAGLDVGLVSRVYTTSAVLRFAVREGFSLLLGLPLALAGIVLHGLPYQANALAVRLARPSADLAATYKLLGALVLFPVAWALEEWAAWRSGGWPAAAGLAALLLPAGFFALAWRERLARALRETRGWLRFLLNRRERSGLAEERGALATQLHDLLRRVPESVLLGTEALG